MMIIPSQHSALTTFRLHNIPPSQHSALTTTRPHNNPPSQHSALTTTRPHNNPPSESSFSIETFVNSRKHVFIYYCHSGYDPNGDYIYTKAEHYGAEEWSLQSDNTDESGRRAVVIYAQYGKKYLAIKNGQLTGLSSVGPDCRWYLE